MPLYVIEFDAAKLLPVAGNFLRKVQVPKGEKEAEVELDESETELDENEIEMKQVGLDESDDAPYVRM